MALIGIRSVLSTMIVHARAVTNTDRRGGRAGGVDGHIAERLQ